MEHNMEHNMDLTTQNSNGASSLHPYRPAQPMSSNNPRNRKHSTSQNTPVVTVTHNDHHYYKDFDDSHTGELHDELKYFDSAELITLGKIISLDPEYFTYLMAFLEKYKDSGIYNRSDELTGYTLDNILTLYERYFRSTNLPKFIFKIKLNENYYINTLQLFVYNHKLYYELPLVLENSLNIPNQDKPIPTEQAVPKQDVPKQHIPTQKTVSDYGGYGGAKMADMLGYLRGGNKNNNKVTKKKFKKFKKITHLKI